MPPSLVFLLFSILLLLIQILNNVRDAGVSRFGIDDKQCRMLLLLLVRGSLCVVCATVCRCPQAGLWQTPEAGDRWLRAVCGCWELNSGL